MKVYYNEFDKKKCAALKQLMADGYISKGEIDDRSIRDVQSGELKEFDRCHFFAGIGLWDYALQLAGWGEDSPVWTGSCPCQPFSTAGRQAGKADDRHLWPEWYRLISECSPPAIFGEQVASAVAKGWLDDVYKGLEAEGYAIGAAVLPASSIGAPHRRERLWFVGHSQYARPHGAAESGSDRQTVQHHKEGQDSSSEFEGASRPSDVADNGWQEVMYTADCDPDGDGWCRVRDTDPAECDCIGPTQDGIEYREVNGVLMGKPFSEGLEGQSWDGENVNQQGWQQAQQNGPAWKTGVWIGCPDGKQRLIEPRIPLLANGYPERVGVIHCAGDAIVPQVAAEFIKASL